jgi:integrase
VDTKRTQNRAKSLKRLVATRVATLPDGTYTDPGQTGLQLRVRSRVAGKPTRTWLLRFKFRGEESRIVLGHFPETTLDIARGLAREARERASQGIDPRRSRPRRRLRPVADSARAAAGSKHSIEFLAQEFMEKYVRPSRDDPAYVDRILKKDVLTEWAGRDARTIKPREVIELLDGIVGRGSPVMANRTGDVISQMFLYGVHRDIVESNPVQLLFNPGGKEKSRERCLSDDEVRILIKNRPTLPRFERLGLVLVIYLLTAVRRSELALARWSEFDFEAKLWEVPAAHVKGRKGERRDHTVPLSDWAVREFQALRGLNRRSRYVLPNVDGDGPINPKLITRNVARAQNRMRKLGIAEFTLHDLRRTCRTGLSRLKGADGKPAVAPHIAERVLHHAMEKIEGTYDKHDYLDEKRDALERWATHLESLMSGRSQ